MNEQPHNQSEIDFQIKEKPSTEEVLEVNECRVCLEEMNQPEIDLNCRCRGPSGLIHQKCFLEWCSKTKEEDQSTKAFFVNCDICREKIVLETQTKCRIVSWREFKTIICGEELKCTLMTAFFILASLGLFVVAVNLDRRKRDKTQKIVVIVGMVITSLIFLGSVLNFFFSVVMAWDDIVVGVKIQKDRKATDQSQHNQHVLAT